MNRIEQTSDDIVQRTSDIIRRRIGKGRATLTSVAREMAMSARTLQRRLREAHTTFAALITAVRIDLAREHLGRGGNVTQIAHQLGLSESSAVSRFLHENGFTLAGLRTQGRARAAGIMGGNFDAIVETIYGEEGPERWNDAICAIAAFLDAPMARGWVTDGRSPESVFDVHTPGIVTDNVKKFDRRFFDNDPRMTANLQRLGVPLSCIDVVDAGEFDQSEIVNEVLDPLEARWTMTQAQRLSGGQILFLGCARPRKQGPYLEPEKRRLNKIFGHFRRALDFELRIGALDQNKRALESVLDVMPQAVVVVSRKLDVLYANRRGAELIVVGNGLGMAHGKLQAMRASEHAGLEGIVAAAASGSDATTTTITAAHGFAIIARAFRLPRAHFIAGGESDWQCALILTSEEWEIDGAVEALAPALELSEAEQISLRQILRDAHRGGGAAEHAIVRKTGLQLRDDLMRLVRRNGA